MEGWTQEDAIEGDPDWRAAFDETLAVQVAGEEDRYLPLQIRENLKLVPEKVKEEVRRTHHALGHVGQDSLLRLARLGQKESRPSVLHQALAMSGVPEKGNIGTCPRLCE